MNNPLMKVSAAIVASAGNLVSNTARWTGDLYWDERVDLSKFVIIHEDHFNHLAALVDNYQTMKAEDELGVSSLVEETIAYAAANAMLKARDE